jgi:two-component system NarL family sensor kinase
MNVFPNMLYQYLLSCFLVSMSYSVAAQDEFDQILSFPQVQDMLDQGIDQKDLGKQALAWYHWAKYEERKSGIRDSAVQYLFRSMERFQRFGDTARYYRVSADLSDWMARRDLIEEAIQMQLKALAFFRQKGDARMEAGTLVRLSGYYHEKGDQAQALQYRRLFRDKNQLVKDTLLDIVVLGEEVQRLEQEHRLDDALQLSLRTLGLARQVQNNRVLTGALFNTGVLYEYSGQYKEALRFLKEAERLNPGADELMRRNIYKHLASSYAGQEGRHASYDYAVKYAQLSDTLLSIERMIANKRFDVQTFLLDAQRKGTEIKMLEKEKVAAQSLLETQRLFLGALAVGFFALLLAGFFILRYYRHSLQTSKVITQQNEEINRRKINELEDKMKIETMQSMLEGQESERHRVAHDLHDSVGGLLAAAKLQLENLAIKSPHPTRDDKDLLKIKALLDETIVETRQIARNLQPGTLLKFGLVKALQDLIQHVKGKGAPEISFQHFGDLSSLPQDTALHCYRILQELLQNALKHAKANEIMVQITSTDQQLAILVEDDGQGFDPQTVQKGMGTGNVQQRVQFLKGDMSVETAPGEGASTLITIPVP